MAEKRPHTGLAGLPRPLGWREIMPCLPRALCASIALCNPFSTHPGCGELQRNTTGGSGGWHPCVQPLPLFICVLHLHCVVITDLSVP